MSPHRLFAGLGTAALFAVGYLILAAYYQGILSFRI